MTIEFYPDITTENQIKVRIKLTPNVLKTLATNKFEDELRVMKNAILEK